MPEEFVTAGDHLVHHCPSWQWAAGSPDCVRQYLPADKTVPHTQERALLQKVQADGVQGGP